MYKKKSIAFLISNLTNSGGTQRVLCCLCNLLIEEFNIIIMTGDGHRSFYALDHRVQIELLSSGRLKIFKRNLEIYNILKKNKISSYVNLDANSIMLNSLMIPKSTKLILWEHFSIVNNYKKTLFTISRHYAVIRSQNMVLLSNFEIEKWNKYNPLAKIKSKLIFNPLPIQVDGEDKLNKINYKTFLAIGNNIEVKGFDILLDCWAKIVSDWRLCIVGLDDNQIYKLESIIENRGMENVQLYGKIEDIRSFYKSSSVFLLPSRKEATPLVLIESQAYGLPAIIFDHLPGVLELVQNSALVADYTEKSISFTKAMKNISNDKDLYSRLHLNALKSSERFNLQEFKKNWLEILE